MQTVVLDYVQKREQVDVRDHKKGLCQGMLQKFRLYLIDVS